MSGLLRIEETTVADVDGWMLTVGNVMRGRWVDADGRAHEGLSAELGIYDAERALVSEFTVGPGLEVRIAGVRWRVAAVSPGPEPDDNGTLTLARLG